jgi:hypothetical protein
LGGRETKNKEEVKRKEEGNKKEGEKWCVKTRG